MKRGFLGVAGMILLASCGTAPLPSPMVSMPAALSPSPRPTATPADPELLCEQLNDPAATDCHDALALAVSALPPGDYPDRAYFSYGVNCGSTSCGGHYPTEFGVHFGLVTFRYQGDTHWKYVYVVADQDGRLQLAGIISESPPPLFSVPTPSP